MVPVVAACREADYRLGRRVAKVVQRMLLDIQLGSIGIPDEQSHQHVMIGILDLVTTSTEVPALPTDE
jgi:hypothetical protein